jgi:hypothetical protein
VASTLSALCLEALRAPPGVSIAPASPESLRARAPKAVTSDAMLDFRTLVPAPGGLYDYKVFGAGTVIDAPPPPLDEPYTPPRTQFARLALAMPLVHPLVLEHAPTRVAELAGWSLDQLATWMVSDSRTGALVEALEHSPDGRALIVREIAVLPPDLRPLARLADDRWQTSPINELYRGVIRRNDALARKPGGTEELHGPLLHLFENEDLASPMRGTGDDVLMSLRGLAGGTVELFAALAEVAAGAPPTGRSYRASAVLFALGFELAG